MLQQTAIEIHGVQKTYAQRRGNPTRPALDGIDLTIPGGSVFGGGNERCGADNRVVLPRVA